MLAARPPNVLVCAWNLSTRLAPDLHVRLQLIHPSHFQRAWALATCPPVSLLTRIDRD